VPANALVSIENTDLETASLSADARFMALIERSRALYKPGTGVSLTEIKRKDRIRTKAKPAHRHNRIR
jgi:hypothetical protein